MNSNAFPVIVMTRNEGVFLSRCIESMIANVSIDIQIYIVDNNSCDEDHLTLLAALEKKYKSILTVIRNKSNRWVLGLNKTLKTIRLNHTSPYFFITDGDIDFTICKARPCWLTYLIEQMDKNIVVGKIGYSLDWNYLSKQDNLKEILAQEMSLYNEKRKINDLYIAQVDTTATIFRWDWSIEGNGNIFPDHMRYLRPELYSCRTTKSLVVEHLGWMNYKSNALSTENIDSKVMCFTIVGASLKKEILSQASLSARVFFYLLNRPFQILWILRRYLFLFKYISSKGRRLFDGQK
ncbi:MULTISPECIES: glycosyltransferase family A protein [Enterobacter cloacae complex]|uniref:glycosyltransferase family A protein n=1 Tax=Enterobacter cloacae complex TaxID=354276 RepID=UPI0009B23D41|nr:glycosyltransferase family A protein [Enterobacter cloacae]EMB9642311.1 glycosyltransferase family 2 protein [Enterobacter cloacae]HBL4973534.1 glycosyltransferase family 2 protein [Enterobacter cloacae]HBM7665431.1 glycosyltransferase family 2 protein [Enterobacter cloacae subsp. cloacae]HEC5297341.1 glycosyltransferase family 2 protein [Enterobacter cloacae]